MKRATPGTDSPERQYAESIENAQFRLIGTLIGQPPTDLPDVTPPCQLSATPERDPSPSSAARRRSSPGSVRPSNGRCGP